MFRFFKKFSAVRDWQCSSILKKHGSLLNKAALISALSADTWQATVSCRNRKPTLSGLELGNEARWFYHMATLSI